MVRATALLPIALQACADGDAHEMSFPVPRIPYSPRQYVAYRTDEPLGIDGRLEEASWARADWTDAFVDIEGETRPTPQYRTRAKMLWDDQYLYVGAGMEEPHVWATLTVRDTIIYHDNDFEVFIDPDGDTHEYYELELNAFGTEWDLLLVRPYRDGGPAINAWDIQGLRTAVHIDGTLNDPGDRDTGWSVEIALPWDVLAQAANRTTPPDAGDQWRINFSRVQWRVDIVDGKYVKRTDNPPGRTRPEDNWVWSPQGLINMHYPEMWGIVQFSHRVAGAGRDEFTASELDPAKWALRRVYYAERAWREAEGRFAGTLAALGLSDLGWPVDIQATDNLFEASLSVEGGRIWIQQDGRVVER